ncbi:MAG: replicative DNA helicase [Sphingobacterium sp.]|nr:replicative DNA helicase [Sphingobacterium sp.]
MGQNERGWKANLRWLVKRENFDKVLERMVDNTRRGSHMDNQLAAQAEQALLGALLFNNKAWDRVADRVSSGDFAQAAHRVIWDVIADQLGAGNAADPFIVATELERRGKLDLLPGGMSYLGLLHGNTPSAANVVQYAERVRDQSILRQLVGVCSDATEEAQSGEGVPSEILEAAQQRIGAIADQAQRGNGAVRMRDLMSDVLGYLDTIHEKGGSLIGQTTGYADLDRKTSGLQGGDLIILAGRPSMGKSTMAVNIAEHIAIREGRPVMVFSLEMSARSLGLRITSSQTRIDFKRLRHMDLQDHEWAFLTSASHRVGNAPLLIDDAAGLTIGDITARARRAHRELGGLALIVVDYLQLITTRGRVENRNIEVSKISQGLKALAKSLDVPVIALSQLSRAVEQRADKRPMMSDLRDSGGIEQDADLIAFIYRDEVYNSQSQDKGTAELIIAKQRNGETGTVRLCSNLHYCRFDDLDPSWRRPEPEPKPQSFAKRGKGPVYDY